MKVCKKIVLLLFITGSSFYSSGQDKQFSGSITDKETGSGIPHATLSLKVAHIGTICNEEGAFDFLIPGELEGDTLVISYLGYQDRKILLDTIREITNIKIELQSVAYNLQEFVVLPMPPTHYIKRAIQKIKENYPDNPFNSQTYYSEKITENDHFIKHHEAVFRTYYPSYQDTVQNQHQLLLYRKEDQTREIAFMRDKIEKKKAKEKRKALKNNEDPDEDYELFDTEGMFGGPEEILKSSKLSAEYPYLDSTNFKKFTYSFSEYSSYQGKALMVIRFEANRNIDHVRYSGKIFLDIDSDAIVALMYYGVVNIPLVAEPVLFALGMGIDRPVFKVMQNYQQINGRWYPKNIQRYFKLDITKKYMFKKNEQSTFEFRQVLNVNKTDLDHAAPIPEEKIFDPKKSYDSQLYNEEGITWKEINVMKK